MEKKLRLLKQHRRHHSLYGIVLTKCSKQDAPNCDYCKDRPLRNKNHYDDRLEHSKCPGRCLAKPCKHDLNHTYVQLVNQMSRITPASGRTPRHCSVCGDTSHNKRTCPSAEQGDEDDE
jgi:hypothetical protein